MINYEELHGLSEQEAKEKLSQEGYNELPSGYEHRILKLLFKTIKEPLFLLLAICSVIYLFLGNLTDALVLFLFVFVVMSLTFYQERKTEKTLEALRNLSSPRALVIRENREMRIAGREVVKGDVLVIKKGDRIPADAKFISGSALFIDESLLTGESIAVTKFPSKENPSILYGGTLITKGSGYAKVIATGKETQMGKIGKILKSTEETVAPIYKKTSGLIKAFGLIGLTICSFIVIVYGLSRGDWIQGTLAGLTLAMTLLPEEFVAVLAIFLSLGAWRIAKNRVLTRHIPAVETLGSATVICFDKTGTLTKNEMSVKKLWAQGKIHEVSKEKILPEAFHEIAEFGLLANPVEPSDPMEKALKDFSEKTLKKTEHLHYSWTLQQEYALSESLLAMSHVWKSSETKKYVIAAKGAPEAIFDLCHFDPQQLEKLQKEADGLAKEGLRVLGVAKSFLDTLQLPDKQHDFDFVFLGLIGFEDPIRESAPFAIEQCYKASIRPVMITDDCLETAKKAADEAHLKIEETLTGKDLDLHQDIDEKISRCSIFARVAPEQKLRIVNTLQKKGEIVAMTGDGINDAPALKKADIGIAMGKKGTDVAREAADLVLLDDNFSSIVLAIRIGRRIFDNIKKAIAYILSAHVPIAGLALLSLFLKLPLILLPVHIVFLELIINPACSIIFETQKEEADLMKRAPRDPKAPILNKKSLIFYLFEGFLAFLIILSIFLFFYRKESIDKVHSITFSSLIFTNIALILTNLSFEKSFFLSLKEQTLSFWIITISAIGVLALAIYLPPLQKIFYFAPLSLKELFIPPIAGFFSLFLFEAMKKICKTFSISFSQ